MRILLIEDDAATAELLKQALTTQHYLVELAGDGQIGWELAEAFEYDLILLDVMLPKLDGIRFCKQLRHPSYPTLVNRNTPVLLMTAGDAGTNRVAGLDAGADDYIAKPFDLAELLARVRALLRRGNVERSPLLVWEDLQLDPSLCQVRYRGQPIHLSSKEYKLLELFLRHPQRIFSHGTLIEHLWALEDIPTENAIRAQIKGVRKKLRESGVADCIETVYGLGYRLKEAQAAQATSTDNSKPNNSKPDTPPTNHHQVHSVLQAPVLQEPALQAPTFSTQTQQSSGIHQFWQQYQPQYRHRLGVIEQATAAFNTATLSEALRQQAQREAHTLKGSLGLFGLDQASEISSEIEQLLQTVDSPNLGQKTRLAELTLRLRQVIEQPPEIIPTSEPDISLPTRSLSSQSSLSEAPQRLRLLIIDGNQALVEQIQQEGSSTLNLEVEVAFSGFQAQARIKQFLPNVVLLNLTFAGSAERGFELLAQLTAQPQIPVLVFTNQESLNDRVRVAQLGGKGFLQMPITPAKVRQAIVNVLQSAETTHAKVLIVDDDIQMMEVLRHLLEPWGFQVTLLSQPQQFWQTLEQVEPDLLLLDIEMPELNGIDLCQVVRNDLRWGDLPILILSAHNDEATVQRVFLAGADDYVSKPIRSAELVARVLARLEQARVLKRLRSLGGL